MVPTTENDRRNLQQPTLERPSLPDHDRRKDEGMHSAIPHETTGPAEILTGDDVALYDPNVEDELAPPDQEFQQILESGTAANHGRIPDDPNNWLTSDPGRAEDNLDPEDRGDSQVDMIDNDKH